MHCFYKMTFWACWEADKGGLRGRKVCTDGALCHCGEHLCNYIIMMLRSYNYEMTNYLEIYLHSQTSCFGRQTIKGVQESPKTFRFKRILRWYGAEVQGFIQINGYSEQKRLCTSQTNSGRYWSTITPTPSGLQCRTQKAYLWNTLWDMHNAEQRQLENENWAGRRNLCN